MGGERSRGCEAAREGASCLFYKIGQSIVYWRLRCQTGSALLSGDLAPGFETGHLFGLLLAQTEALALKRLAKSVLEPVENQIDLMDRDATQLLSRDFCLGSFGEACF